MKEKLPEGVSYNTTSVSYATEQKTTIYKNRMIKCIKRRTKEKTKKQICEESNEEKAKAAGDNQPLADNTVFRDIKNDKDRIRRARKNILHLAKSNRWDSFITLTLSAEKVNRYNYNEVSKKLSRCLQRICENDPTFEYLLVVEQHKDGAYHYHGLISGGTLIPTEHRNHGRRVYHLKGYNLGFCNVTEIDSENAVIKYCTKHFLKQINGTELPKGCHSYVRSQGLEEEEIEKYNLTDEEIVELIAEKIADGFEMKEFEVPEGYMKGLKIIYLSKVIDVAPHNPGKMALVSSTSAPITTG